MKFWSDFSDHGGEVHDSEALNDLGMAALMGVKVEVQEGASGGGKASEAHSTIDGEESEGAKGKKSVPQSRRKVKVIQYFWIPFERLIDVSAMAFICLVLVTAVYRWLLLD